MCILVLNLKKKKNDQKDQNSLFKRPRRNPLLKFFNQDRIQKLTKQEANNVFLKDYNQSNYLY